MAIRTFNSVGGFSVGEVPVQVIDNTGNIANVNKATIGNVTVATSLVAGNIKANNLTNTQVTFTNNGILSDSANLTFSGNLLTITDSANITNGTQYISITGSNGGITTSGNASLANGAFTINTNGDAAIANSLTVGANGSNGDSAFYVDAAGNFSIKIANTTDTANGGFTTVFSVDAVSGNITTAGSVVSPGGGSATITAPGTNTQILFNDGGNVGASSLFTFDKNAQALTVDGNIQLLDNTTEGTGRLVLPQGGYIYGDSSYSAVVHSENGGYAQLEYIDPSNEAYVYVESTGAFMEQGSAHIKASNSEGVELEYNGSRVNASSSGTKVSTNNGGVYFDARVDGSAYIGTNSGETEWAFDTSGIFTTPGSIVVPGGDIYANSGLVNANTLNIVNQANLHGDAGIDGSLTVNGTSTLLENVTIGVPGDVSADLDVAGNLHVYQDATVDGGLTIANLNVTNYVTSNLIPSDDVTYDLGSDDHRWRDLWLSGFTINLGNTTISSGGSNNMIVSNAVVGYPGTYGTGGNAITLTTGNLNAGIFLTAGDANIGNTANKANLFVSGNAAIDQTTVSSSTTTGALTVKGGVGIGGNIYIGGATANISGNVLISGAEANVATGNLRVGGSANIIGNLVIGGNLTVSGTTTYVNTTNSSIKDALIDIAGANNGADLSAYDAYDRGLYIHNYGTGVNNQFMGWKQAVSEFQLKTGVTSTGNAISGGSYANVRVGHLFGTVGTTSQNEIQDMGGLVTIDVSDYANITGTANIATAIITSSLTIGELTFPIQDYSTPINDNEIISLTTNGEGTLGFTVIHTDTIANGASNVFVNNSGNVTVTVDGAPDVLIVTSLGANVTGTLDVTGELSAGSLRVGSLTPDSITLGNTSIQHATYNSTNTSQVVIAEVLASSGNAVEFFVKGKAIDAGQTYLTVATITALYDGSNVDYSTYGKMHMGGVNGAGVFDINYAGDSIQLLVTPTRNVNTVWTAQIRTI